jgi:hypothetical protein
MTGRSVDREDPDRLYTVTGGRAHADTIPLDLVTLIVSEGEPSPGMQSEHVRILSLCRQPAAVVEISADLRLPISVVKILLGDLLETGKIAVRQPAQRDQQAGLPDRKLLKQVLVGLERLV